MTIRALVCFALVADSAAIDLTTAETARFVETNEICTAFIKNSRSGFALLSTKFLGTEGGQSAERWRRQFEREPIWWSHRTNKLLYVRMRELRMDSIRWTTEQHDRRYVGCKFADGYLGTSAGPQYEGISHHGTALSEVDKVALDDIWSDIRNAVKANGCVNLSTWYGGGNSNL